MSSLVAITKPSELQDGSLRNPPGLWLDGVKLTPSPSESCTFLKQVLESDAGTLAYYRVPVGQWILEYFLCPISSVGIDTNTYLSLQQDLDEDIEDDEHCRVVFKDSVSQRCTFDGECLLRNVAMAECHIVSSDITADCEVEKYFNIYVHNQVIESELHNVVLSKKSEVIGSWLHDVSIISETSACVRIDQCELQHSRFYTKEIIQLDHMYAENTHIEVTGLLKVACVNWSRVRITGESMHIAGRMFFLEVVLPRVTFFVYCTGSDKWAIAPDLRGNRFSLNVDQPDIEEKLTEVLDERGQMDKESCLQYIYDSIASRIKVMEALNQFRHKEYLRLSAVC